MRKPGARIHLSTMLLVLTACSGGEPSARRPSGVRDTLPNGIVRVRYGQLPSGPVKSVGVDLRLGTVEGDPNLIFGDVRSVEAGRDGTIYVLDYQASEIRAFDSTGTFLRTVASRGEGPGEITEANGMILVGDSVLWVQDHGKWMMIGITTLGEEVGRFPMPSLSYGYIWNGTVDDAGRVWKPRSHSDQDRSYPPEEGLLEGSVREYLVVFDPEREVTDSVYLGTSSFRTMIHRNARGGYTYRQIPFDSRPITAVDPAGGIWRTASDRYRIARLSEEGDTILVLESDAPAPPVTQDDRSGYVEGEVEQDPAQRRVAEEIAELIHDTKPMISSLTVDDGGRLWVRRWGTGGSTTLFDVFSADGSYQGSVELGFELSTYMPIRVRRGRIYTVVRDSLDVPFVVRTTDVGF